MNRKNTIILLVNAIISLIAISLILYAVDIIDVINRLIKVDLFLLSLSVIALLAMYVGMAARIKILLTESGINIGWLAVFKSHFIGMLLADFTPARSGYFAAAASLHYNYKVPDEKALVSIFGPQIFDFALKIVVGTIAIIFLLSKFLKDDEKSILLLISILITLLVTVMILTLFSSRFLSIFSPMKKLPVLGNFLGKILSLFQRMQRSSAIVVKKTPELLVLLLFTWSMKSISWYFVAKSLGITIVGINFPEFLFYFLFQPLITMLEFIPSPTIAGIGLSEGGTALVLSLFSISPAAATSFAVLARVKTIVINLLALPFTVDLMTKIIPKMNNSIIDPNH